MKSPKACCLVLSAAFLLFVEPACAQMYSWKDPDTGQSRLSNIAPSWYSRADAVRGPRVIRTVAGRVVDDTALPYEERLALSGRSRDDLEKLRLQKSADPRPPQDPPRESAKSPAQAPDRNAADVMSSRAAGAAKKGG